MFLYYKKIDNIKDDFASAPSFLGLKKLEL